ncbi:MAG TPA: sugar ABC transporter substrate-binding protein, partial [Bacteroidota bacterium]
MPVARRFPACLLIVLLALSSCSENEGSPPPETITLTYWPAPNPEEIKLADTLVALWNKLHPSVRVIMQPIPVSQSTEEVLLAAIAARTTPDICSNIWPGALHDYTVAGGLVALDEFPDFDSLMMARIPANLLPFFREEEKHTFQIPWKTNPV